MSKSKDLREAAVTYKKAGNSYEETGKVFGVSASTVSCGYAGAIPTEYNCLQVETP